MEGYFNFGFTNSFRKTSSRILSYRSQTDETRSDSDWNCDSIERSSLAEIDTDLDSDSFLSDLEKDSGENKTECQNHETVERRYTISEERGSNKKYSESEWNGAVHRGGNQDLNRKADATVLKRSHQPYCVGANLVSSLGPPLSVPNTLEDGVFSNPDRDKNTADPAPTEGKSQLASLTRQASCCSLSCLDTICLTGLLSLLTLLLSQAVPCWLLSPGVSLGPWQACFHTFPVQGLNTTYQGCYPLWASQFRSVRGWLLPAWFLVVQSTLILGTLVSSLARGVSALIWFKRRQIFPLRLGSRYLLLSAWFDVFSGVFLLVSSLVFAGSCWSRAWLFQHQQSLSWGWAIVLLASWTHFGTAGFQFLEVKKQKRRKVENENFLKNLEPPLFALSNG
jgi:hypothetical protein